MASSDDRGSRGGAASNGSSAGRGQSPYILTEDGHHSQQNKPRTLIQALSDIQQYYIMESCGRVIPGELFTLQGSLDFMSVGFRSGFSEGLLLLILAPIVEFWLLPSMKNPDLSVKIFAHCIPFIQVGAYSIICAWMAKYYMGSITKKAISAVLGGRLMMILVKAFLIFLIFNVISKWGAPEHSDKVWSLIEKIPAIKPEAAGSIFNWFYHIQPTIRPIANWTAMGLLLGGVFPYFSLLMADRWKSYLIMRNQKRIGSGLELNPVRERINRCLDRWAFWRKRR